MENDEKKQETQDESLEDEEFIDSLLNEGEEEDDPKDESKKETSKDDDEDPKKEAKKEEEEIPQKNKDAEAARKRREEEAKKAKEKEEAKGDESKKDDESKDDEDKGDEDKKDEDNDSKAKGDEDKQRSANQAKLGEQLSEFKRKYPDVDLAKLDEDKNFKRYIDGKLLGKKNFTEVYEEYLDFTESFSSESKKTVERNHRKANSSSGKAQSGPAKPADVYSENELEKIAQKLPFMPRKEAEKVEAKLNRSIEYHENN